MPVNKNHPALTMSLNGLKDREHGVSSFLNTLHSNEFMDNPDHVVSLNSLAADNNLNVIVPDAGRFALTDWSRSQLSSMLGIRFDKWFENSDPQDQAYELNRRFARASGEVKLRTTVIGAGENENDGTLKGIVSPSFSAIKDSQIAEHIFASMTRVDSEIRLIRADVTTKTTSFVISIGSPFVPGDQREIGAIFGGLHIQNSGVGFASLAVTLHITRLVCSNGMTVPISNAELLRRRHTSGLTIESVRQETVAQFGDVPRQIALAGIVLKASREIMVPDIAGTIGRILQKSHLPKKLVEPLLETYMQNPEPTAFGVAQALTDSQTISRLHLRPEERLLLEQAAGGYLQEMSTINH